MRSAHETARTALCVILAAALGVTVVGCEQANGQDAGGGREPDWTDLRERMVRQQIETRGVKDPAVLAAMRSVPRHRFVPDDYREASYNDSPLPIGEGQTISQPYIVALMSELLEVGPGDRVLEIGTGSGYQAAVLAAMGVEVYSVEIRPRLCERAEAVLDGLGYDKVHVRCGDGYGGWPEASPFAGVIVTAAPERIPQPLIDQLAVGARMVIPLGDFYQQLMVIKKTDSGVEERSVIPVRFVPMTGEIERQDEE
ncbi:MAG: protein-L-isoaspartate(D-aspartate) O-methyltransferase [Thermoanaerobaculales bacterium]|jgi:protein-L-isoaspartate(D-aspartate) O-methyltransferase|nr:protein-L-isoaspartate(D-aspartate) O-methyltransferase [Thermoanaerobaculales bacterium]